MKKIALFATIFLNICQVYGQTDSTNSFDEKMFFENLKTSYYSLNAANIKNITVLLTNISTEEFAKREWKNSEIFPLQLMWLSPDRLFLSQQGVPSLSDSSQKVYTSLVDDLKSQITDILFDLNRFYFSDIYNFISEDYNVENKKDVVKVTFNSVVNTDTTYYQYFFGLNGLCLKILSYEPSKNLTIETNPYFKTSKTKWIVGGWQVKMHSNKEISTGYFAELKFKEKKNIWFPTEIILTVQRKTELGKTFSEVLKFRNLLFNQSLQYIDQ